MVSEKTTIINKLGLHMRPASMFVQEMLKFKSDMTIAYNGKSINGKSIMQVMTAAIKCGTEVELTCTGEDEAEMLQKAVDLIKAGLGDEI